MAILLPEVVLFKLVKGLLQVAKDDYNNAANKDDSLLAYMFKGQTLNTFDFYQSAINMLTKPNTERRVLDVTVGYNQSRAEMPTIHIILPSEQLPTAPIGSNSGYEDDILTYDPSDTGHTNPLTHILVYTYDSFCTYNLLITSDNVLEVIVIYNTLKYLMISASFTLAASGFINAKFGGSDLSFDESLLPNNAFHRNFNFTFQFENSIRDIQQFTIGKTFTLDPTILEN